MSIVFYYAPMSSASPVAWALAELGVPHEKVLVDLKAGDQRKPEFLALNPNGKVPTLVAGGVPMFEGLAIMMWLGDRFGVEKQLWPRADDPMRQQAMAWSTWAYVSVGTALHILFVATSDKLAPEVRNAMSEHATKDVSKLLGILDNHLASRAYVLGDGFSIADVIVASVVGWGGMVGVQFAAHPRVADWLARCESRPAHGKAAS